MAGILVKGTKSYDYDKAVKGSSFIRLYDVNGYCFKSFLDISTAGFADYAAYELSTDTSAVTDKVYYVRKGNIGNYSFVVSEWTTSAYELVQITELDVAKVAGVGVIAAECGNLVDKKLTLVLPTGTYIQSELQINFKTPVASCDLAYIVIDNIEFELVDASDIRVDSYICAFAANSIVSVIIDLVTNKAAVQNLKFNSIVKVSTDEPDATDDVEVWINPDGICNEIDTVVTKDSKNLVTSGAVYNYVNDNKITTNGILKGDGAGNLSSAVEGSDYSLVQVKSIMLSANLWNGTGAPYAYTYSDTDLKNNVFMVTSANTSAEVRNAAYEARINIYSNNSTEIVFIADGTLPTVDIPITLIMF